MNQRRKRWIGEKTVPKTIQGKGYFTYLVSALAAGDVANVATMRLMGRAGLATDILNDLNTVAEIGFARFSRNGNWRTLEHPHLGMVQWKRGIDFRTKGRYFFLRLNGTQILTCWPKAGGRTVSVKWEQCPESSDELGTLPWDD